MGVFNTLHILEILRRSQLHIYIFSDGIMTASAVNEFRTFPMFLSVLLLRPLFCFCCFCLVINLVADKNTRLELLFLL